MKKHIIYLLVSGFALLSNMALTSCSDDDVADANDVLAVKSVLPTKVMEGQVITINGTGLEKATSVVFPGNVSVNNITKIGNGYISVITPAGVSAEGGRVTIVADGESAESVMTLTVGKPEPLRVAPLDKKIKINECVEVYGNDLEFITKAYFPGEDGKDIIVDASDFKRKATGSLYIYSPMGIKAGPAQVVIEDCSGKKYTLPEVTLAALGEENPFEGEWVWASGVVWGDGAYLQDKAPSGWKVEVGDELDKWGEAPGEGRAGSSIVFTNTSLTKKRSDGTTVEGKYTFDMTKTKDDEAGAKWAIGQLVTQDITVLCGRWPWQGQEHDIYTYDILEITSDRIVLAYTRDGAKAGDQTLFWIFERKNQTVTTYPVDVNLTQKQMVTLNGIDDIADWWIDPDFFTKIEGSDNKFVFEAIDGSYRINADKDRKYFIVEVLSGGVPAKTNDDGTGTIWIIGDKIGKPTNANNIGWTDNKAICMAPIGDKKYRITLVAGTQIATDAINFKFFHQKGWGGEFKHDKISTTSDLVFVGDDNNGADSGNINLKSGIKLEEGVAYEFVVDLSGGIDKAVLTVTRK